jgi:hypothetical protein
MSRTRLEPSKSWNMMTFRAISLALILSGCNLTPAPVLIHVCPVAPAYSAAFEKQAGQQLSTLPPGSPIVKMISDYIAVRSEIRACH